MSSCLWGLLAGPFSEIPSKHVFRETPFSVLTNSSNPARTNKRGCVPKINQGPDCVPAHTPHTQDMLLDTFALKDTSKQSRHPTRRPVPDVKRHGRCGDVCTARGPGVTPINQSNTVSVCVWWEAGRLARVEILTVKPCDKYVYWSRVTPINGGVTPINVYCHTDKHT